MFTKSLTAAALGALLLAAPAANAAVTVVSGPTPGSTTATFTPAPGINTAIFNFNGFSGNNAPAIPGLTAQLTLTLLGVVGNSYQFSYALANTSGGDIDASRVTIFGFNSNPNFSSVSGLTGPFNVVASGQQPNGLNSVEVCFKDAGPANNCTGASQGVGQGNSVNGTFNLNFAAAQASVALSDFSVRYQGIESAEFNIRDGSASGVPFGMVPEPATWAFMILGFGLIGGALRSRKAQATRVTYA
jgi:PEP-CTERM motif